MGNKIFLRPGLVIPTPDNLVYIHVCYVTYGIL